MDKAITRFFSHKGDGAGERPADEGPSRAGGQSRHSPTSESLSGEESLESSQRQSSSVPSQMSREVSTTFFSGESGSVRLLRGRHALTPPPALLVPAADVSFSCTDHANDANTATAERKKSRAVLLGGRRKHGTKHTNPDTQPTDAGASSTISAAPRGDADDTVEEEFISYGSATVPVAAKLTITADTATRKGHSAPRTSTSASPPAAAASATTGSDPFALGGGGGIKGQKVAKAGDQAGASDTPPAAPAAPAPARGPLTELKSVVTRISSTGKGEASKAAARRGGNRNEPFDEESNGSSLSPASDHSSEERQSDTTSPSTTTALSSAGTSSFAASASHQQPAKRAAPQRNAFYLHTKPRLGRFTNMISFLLSQAEAKLFLRRPATWSEEVRHQYKKHLSLCNLITLCDEATRILSHEPSLLQIKVSVDHEEMVVVGDIHGQFMDLYHSVLSQQWNYRVKNKERKDKTFLFLGDFVDRGPNSLETILLVLALKVEYPHLIFLLRGNHEEKSTSRVYGFLTEVQSKLGRDEGAAVWEIVTSTFASLPLAAAVRVENKKRKDHSFSFFATHGGLAPGLVDSLDAIGRIRRESYGITREKTALSFLPAVPGDDKTGGGPAGLSLDEEQLCKGLMWSDPTTEVGLFGSNPRGCGFLFGPSASSTFCEKNGFDFVARAHQVVMEGYLWKHNDHVLTVFSAPNYCGINGNLGAIMVLHGEREPGSAAAATAANPYASGVSFNTCAFQDKAGALGAARGERSSHRYISFVQYDAVTEDDDADGEEELVVQPNLDFPYASCFF